nr:flagellin [uncultured Oscillibacter sp.]
MRIQHNIMAMNAYRNYNTNTSALSKNLEKLSSGYKINRAGDDAAGLAISEKMRAQITGLNAAQKNVKDGISLVKTAEGAMQEIQDMLNRMDYLATQSANGTYDDPVDRKNLQKEVDALKTEINRIADSANFNGINLLDGSQSAGGANGVAVNVDLKVENAQCGVGQLHEKGVSAQAASFQVDLKQAIYTAAAKATIAANTSFSLTVKVGGQDFTVKVTTKSSIAAGGVISQGAIGNLTFSCSAATAAAGVELTSGDNTAKFTGTLGNDGVLKFALKTGEPMVDFTAAMDVEIEADGPKLEFKTGDDYKTTYNCNTQNVQNGFAAKNDKLAHGEFEFTKNMANALANGGTLKLGDAKYDQIEITFDKDKLGKDATGTVVGVKDLLDADGNLKVDDKSLAEMVARISKAANGSSTFTVGAGSSDKMISLTEKFDYYDAATDKDDKLIDTKSKFQNLISITGGATGANAAGGLTLQIGDTAESYNQLTVSIGDMHTSSMVSATAGNSIADIDISSRQGAQDAIQTIRDAINYVSGVRGDLGATQNRLEHTANNLSVMAENIQDAESTIRDTDVAEEMMKYTKNNILVQSAQAMLAQANAVPQGVLQLLG